MAGRRGLCARGGPVQPHGRGQGAGRVARAAARSACARNLARGGVGRFHRRGQCGAGDVCAGNSRRPSGRGPLGGICAALASTEARWAVFLPVDLPLLPSSLVRHLLVRARASERSVTLVSLAGFGQTFPAVLDKALLPLLRAELDAGRGGCFSAFNAAAAALGQSVDMVPAETLAETGQVAHPEGVPAASWFFNINSGEDLLRAEALLPGGTRRL